MSATATDRTSVATSSPGDAAPSTDRRRIADVDALRGFALLGILVVNVTFFASAFTIYEIADPAFSSGFDDLGRWIVAVLFTSKFYVLFSFLFGYSFTLQLAAADRSGAAFRPRFLRRLLGLFAIGAAHAVLLWQGDILTTYAVLGLVLLLIHRISPRRAVVIAGLIVLASATLFLVAGLDELARGTAPDLANQIRGATDATAYWRGSFGDVIAQRISELPTTFELLLFLQAPTALAMFLLGLAAGRRRLLADVSALRPALTRIARIALPLGVAGGLLYAFTTIGHAGTGRGTIGAAVDVLSAPVLAAGYVAALLLFFGTARGERVRDALAPAGRMALSNYVLQSLVCAFLFTGYGLGLVGHVSPVAAIVIAATIYAAQLVGSAWWMRRHRYGPLEWLLRWFTNGERPPWRRAAASG